MKNLLSFAIILFGFSIAHSNDRILCVFRHSRVIYDKSEKKVYKFVDEKTSIETDDEKKTVNYQESLDDINLDSELSSYLIFRSDVKSYIRKDNNHFHLHTNSDFVFEIGKLESNNQFQDESGIKYDHASSSPGEKGGCLGSIPELKYSKEFNQK